MDFQLDQNLFPEWKLVDLIGEGSFGKVYLIKKQLLDGEIFSALKVITIPQSSSQVRAEKANGMSDVEIRDYFKSIVEDWHKEIILLNSLKGITNVVNIEDYKIIESSTEIRWDIYIRMEYVDNFNDIIAREAITDSEALKLGMDLCQALVYCQRRRIVHRDIKPENIFRSQFGDYKLGDFGIARQIEKTNSSLSKKGTYLYMAPEVYNGKTYDARADIYSLGLVLYRLFNGNQIPFIAPNVTSVKFSDKESSIQRRMDGEVLPHPGLANDKIANVILKACSPDPEHRYPNAVEFFNDLYGLYTAIKEPAVIMDISKKLSASMDTTSTTDSSEQEKIINIQRTQGIFDRPYPTPIVQGSSETEALVKEPDVLVTQPEIEEQPAPPEDFVAEPMADESEPEVEPESETEIVQVAEKQKHKNPIQRYVYGIAALVIFIIVASMIAMNSEPTAKMPDLVGKSMFYLSRSIDLDDFDIEYVYQETSDKNAGTIIEQSIDPGSKLEGDTPTLILHVAYDQTHAIVPNLVGQTRSNAKQLLEDLGFVVEFDEKLDDTKEAGTILDQSVVPNYLFEKGKAIKLTVVMALTLPKVTMPNGANLLLSDFTDDLDALELVYTTSEEYSDTVAAGKVISHEPAGGVEVEKGSAVTIIVSKGKAPATTVVVPSGSGKTVTTFKATLTDLGLKFTVTEQYSDTVASGVVISHSPAKNASVAVGSTVAIVVSKGKAPINTVSVPSGAGKTLDAYKKSLTDLGLKFTVTEQNNNSVAVGVVISHAPAANAKVDVGSTVAIVVSKGEYPWSEWLTSLPTNVTDAEYEIVSQIEYGYSNKQTTTAATSTLAGWVLYNSAVTSYGSWGAWQTGVLNDSDTIDAEQRTIYRYYRLYWSTAQAGDINYSFKRYASWATPKYFDEMYLTSPLTADGNYTDYREFTIPFNASLTVHRFKGVADSPYKGAFIGSYPWTSNSSLPMLCNYCWYQNKALDGTFNTFLEYRSRTKIYTYYFYKYDQPTSWSATRGTAGTDQKEFTRTVYRYRKK